MKNTLILSLVLLWTLSSRAALDPIVAAEDERQPESPALVKALKSESAGHRVRATLALGRIRSAKSIDQLLGLLKDPNRFVRSEAAFALGQLGWEETSAGGREKEIAAKLVDLLKTEADIPARATAVEALGKIGLTDTPVLVAPFLENEAGMVTAEAVLALYRYRLVMKLRKPAQTLEDIPAAAIAQMRVLADAVEYPVRRNVAYYFARVKDARGLDIAEKLSSDTDKWIRLFAVQGMAKIGAASSLSILLKRAAEDFQSEVQTAAIGGVAALGESAKLDPVLAHDMSLHVRAAFAQALAAVKDITFEVTAVSSVKIREADADKLLEEMMADKSRTVAAAALQSYAKRKKGLAKALLVQTLSKKSWVMKEAAVQILSVLGTEQVPLLKTALADQDVRVRSAAIEQAAEIPDSWAFEAIVKALSSNQLSERGMAASVLGSRKEDSRADIAFKAYQNSISQKWIETRETLLDVVNSVPGDVTTRYLLVMVKDPAPSVACKAWQALKDRGVTDLPELPAKPALTYSPFRELTFNFDPVVVLTTNKGEIYIQTYPRDAQIHVANFVGQVKAGLYKNSLWHRVVSNFVVQGGDPDGTGWGDAGYNLRSEINHHPFSRGALGMPRGQGFDTGGVQLFINHIPTPHLEGQYTVFGQVIRGLEIIDRLEKGDLILNARVL